VNPPETPEPQTLLLTNVKIRAESINAEHFAPNAGAAQWQEGDICVISK
jgi:hypothetical protein